MDPSIRHSPREPTGPALDRTDITAELTASLWLNVQPGQPVLIRAEVFHRDLANKIAHECQKCGASEVIVDLIDPKRNKELILNASLEELSSPPKELAEICRRMAQAKGGFVKIIGSEDPLMLTGVDPERAGAFSKGQSLALQPLTSLIMKGLTNRCLLGAATPGWAQLVFPEMEPGLAYGRLKEIVDDVVCVSAPNPVQEFLRQDATLEIQRERLQGLSLRALRFVGEGTDLTVGLSDRALWLGGKKSTPEGVVFYANVPIGEIFTTPDWRTVTGKVRMTMPSIIGQEKVEGVEMIFESGHLVNFQATAGKGSLEHLLKREPDGTSSRLGEIALVSMDTPLAKYGALFMEILFDEKGRCHLALGQPYLSNIIGGKDLSPAQIETLGINKPNCLVHHDFMISDSSTTVYGITASGEQALLLEHGVWAR